MNWRIARAEDAAQSVPLIYTTMGRFADFLFGLDSAERALQALEILFRHPHNRLSHTFTQLCEKEKDLLGLLLAYPGSSLPRLDLLTGKVMFTLLGMRNFLTFVSRALVFSGIREAHDGEYYIQALAVTPSLQGRGIGWQILEHAEQTARSLRLSALSLLVSLKNQPAQKLYLRFGFQTVQEIRPSHLEQKTGIPGFWRMVKSLSTH